jgi:hypothetical protein
MTAVKVATVLLLCALVSADPAFAIAKIDLGRAGPFTVLAGSTVTNTGPTVVSGNVGVSPGTAITGFLPGKIVGGSLQAGTQAASLAKADLSKAYDKAASLVDHLVLLTGNLGGKTLFPGLYKSAAGFEISSGDLTLDAQGNPNAVFVFQMASTLTLTSGRRLILKNGTNADNIYWQVGSSATLGTGSALAGIVMAYASVTMTTGATLNGRLLAINAAVTLDSNTLSQIVSKTSCLHD